MIMQTVINDNFEDLSKFEAVRDKVVRALGAMTAKLRAYYRPMPDIYIFASVLNPALKYAFLDHLTRQEILSSEAVAGMKLKFENYYALHCKPDGGSATPSSAIPTSPPPDFMGTYSFHYFIFYSSLFISIYLYSSLFCK